MLPKVVRIRENIRESPHHVTLVLEAEAQGEPGQFLMAWLPGVDEKPYSLVDDNPVTLLVAEVGPFSQKLSRLKAGDLVGYRGLYGKGFALPKEGPLLLVGGGCGVAALHLLAKRARGLRVRVAIGAETAAQVLYAERFQALDCQVLVSTDDGTRGVKGLVTEAIEGLLAEARCVYGCGPEPMLKVLTDLCLERGLPGQMSLERYMKCGFGVCGHCALDDRLVCRDGPVFAVEELATLSEFGRLRRDATGRRVPLL